MKVDVRSALVLLVTLLLGALIGALVLGQMQQRRLGAARELRRPGGFVEHLESVIRPRDSAQAAVLQPLLETTARRNAELMQQRNRVMREELDALVEQLRPLLDADQLERLERFARRPPPGPPGMGPRGERRGPRDARPPHEFEGGPPPDGPRDRGPPPEGPPPGGPPPGEGPAAGTDH